MTEQTLQKLRILLKRVIVDELKAQKQIIDQGVFDIINIVKDQFKLDLESVHGTKHWSRVAEIGAYLSEHTKADAKVVELFAYFHDSKREDDDCDLDHGVRASVYVQDLYEQGLLGISTDQLENLVLACKYHNNPEVKSDNVTIQTCWDADRLDLWRVGIVPQKRLLNTDFAKQDHVIDFWSNKSR